MSEIDDCDRCLAPIRWIDAYQSCPDGCAYCADCGDELGGSCANGCGALVVKASRAKPVPRR